MRALVFAIVAIAISACGGGERPIDARVAPDHVNTLDAAPHIDAGRPDGQACEYPVVQHEIYLNRVGGTFHPGTDDALLNSSVVLPTAATIVPPQLSDAEWADLVLCLHYLYGMWSLGFDDVEDSYDHREVVFVGNWAAVSPDATAPMALAIPPCPVASVDPTPRAVIMINAEMLAADIPQLCDQTAAAIAYSYGLDAEWYCPDSTSLVRDCLSLGYFKSFVPKAHFCGEDHPRACRCGGFTQSSYGSLGGMLGNCY